MRGRVSEPCSRYLFNDRIHYLDDRSLSIYQEGVKRYHGVFTVETFESVVNAPHTLGRVNQNDPSQPVSGSSSASVPQPDNELRGTLPATADAAIDDPDVIPFGYFKERSEPRLQMICETEVRIHGAQIKGVTRDMSVSGAQLFIEDNVSVQTGDEISVSFMGLQREADGVDVYDIAYIVVGQDFQDDGTLLRLQRTEPGKWSQFDKFIESLLKRRDPDARLDIEDDFQSALAWYYERLYAENSSFIPVFAGKDDSGDLMVQSVALTRGNQFLTRFFCTSTDNYNFTPLCLPHCLQTLQAGKPVLIAMYRHQGDSDRSQRIHSAASNEFSSDRDFLGFVRHVLSYPQHCIVKVIPGSEPLQSLSTAKINLLSSKLRSLSSEQASMLDRQIDGLQMVAYMADMTGWAGQLSDDESLQCPQQQPVWVGSEQRVLSSGEVCNRLEADWRSLNPELIRFGYAERRREHRYLARTAVTVQIQDTAIDGMTQDLSWHGMRILLPAEVEVKQGSMIKVGLTTMQEKRGAIDLMNIPYRVAGFRYDKDGTLLMLERITGNRDSAMDEFFAELIARNRHKLPVDTGDVVHATTASLFEAIQSANTPALVFFLGMDREQGATMQYLGLPVGGNLLARNIGRGKDESFGYLFSQKLVKAMYDAVQLSLRQPDQEQSARPAFEFDLMVYEDAGNEAVDGFSVASEIDGGDAGQWRVARREIMAAENWRGLRVVVSHVHAIEDKLFDTLLFAIRDESRHRAMKLSDAVVSVTGYGEIFDITDDLALLPDCSGE